MTDDGKQFRLLRAERTRDSSAWLPADAVERFLTDIREGKAKPCQLVILYTQEMEEDEELETHRYYGANVTQADVLWMMEARKYLMMQESFGD